MIRHTMDNAAYEGARRGIVPGATEDDIKQQTQGILSAVSINGATVIVTPKVLTAEIPDVTVQVDVPCNSNGWLSPFFFRGRTFSSTCRLAREGY